MIKTKKKFPRFKVFQTKEQKNEIKDIINKISSNDDQIKKSNLRYDLSLMIQKFN